MKTIRQLYMYLISLVSLEVVVWGMIRLSRTLANPLLKLDAGQLAGALALIVVGLPIFWFHWQSAQKQAYLAEEERYSGVRALFLYSALLATLIPILQNLLALVDRSLLVLLQQPASQAIFGGGQIWSDNLIAVLMNSLLWLYIFITLRKDWDEGPSTDHLRNIRRLYRYILLLYGLALVVGGLHEVIRFLLGSANTVGGTARQWLANGLALLLVGVPFWLFIWLQIQRSLGEKSERTALLRQVILFILSLFSALGVLISGGAALNVILKYVLGTIQTGRIFWGELSEPAAFIIPLGGIWAYYGRAFRQTFTSDEITRDRTVFQKLYTYFLAGSGVTAVIIGLDMLFKFLIDLILRTSLLWGLSLQDRLAASLATLLVGLPLWLLTWRIVQQEINQQNTSGERAQRSLIRKSYVYLMLFGGVIGVMISGGQAVFLVFKSLLGLSVPDLLPEVLSHFGLLILFGGLFAYHLHVHRQDLNRSQRSLSEMHAKFPVWILTQEGDRDVSQLVAGIQQEAPDLPVTVHDLGKGLPLKAIDRAKAVVLTGRTAAGSAGEFRSWLDEYQGKLVAVPTNTEKWLWVTGADSSFSTLARQTARLLREMAEGEEEPSIPGRSPLQSVFTILGILFSIQILFGLLAVLTSLIVD